MNRLFLSFLIVVSVFAIACRHHKKIQMPIKPVEIVKPVETPDTNTYVPFTKDLFNRLKAYNIDVKKVQFFVDQQMILNRYIDVNKAELKSGVVKFVNGRYTNEIVIPALTPCVIDSIDVDGFRVSFEKGSYNVFKFINNKYSPDFFIFSGSNWKDGTAEVYYDRQVYRVSCGTCSSVSEVKLMVKQSDMDKSETKTKVLTGRKVDF
ncbi:MAG TPA: hypothetical protein VHP12_02140 [Chitinophagaceae bacterium]|nr:hypothetical protein [Chitinophagaceae bacterium]